MSVSSRAFVIGSPIKHSRSPLIHGFWLKQFGLGGSYEKIEVAPEALPSFLRGMEQAGFVGGNVTVPHKVEVLALAERIDAAGRAIGAANTLWRKDGHLIAGNTDAYGFLANLDAEAPGWDAGGSATVLGAGGAARAVVYALLGRGFSVDVVNRSLDKAQALARDFGSNVRPWATGDTQRALERAGLLVNTTSLGMAGQPPMPLDISALKPSAIVHDIVYVPLETDLLRDARERGHRTVGGLGMLLHQAVPGFERWFGVRPEVTAELRALVEADLETR